MLFSLTNASLHLKGHPIFENLDWEVRVPMPGGRAEEAGEGRADKEIRVEAVILEYKNIGRQVEFKAPPPGSLRLPP